MLTLAPREDLWIEVPSELVAEENGREFVGVLSTNGFKLVMRGRPLGELPPDLLDAFQMSLIPISQDRRINQSASERAKH
ncbi:MAG: hypothetical protein R3E68_08365 [Burkholderiaceae bacterium]